MAIEKALVSGSMAMLVMKLLSEKDMYGYEMIDTLRQKSQNVFELKVRNSLSIVAQLGRERTIDSI
mgnify:CR=1 FL=1